MIEIQIDQFWILIERDANNFLYKFEQLVLNTLSVIWIWKLKIFLTIYRLISAFYTQ